MTINPPGDALFRLVVCENLPQTRGVFIKAHLSFQLGEHSLDFVHQNLSPAGVSGLPWSPLNPMVHFGKKVQVQVRLATAEPRTLTLPATIFKEQTQFNTSMGLRFDSQSPDIDLIKAQARKFGNMPTEYMRKYPRLPADPGVSTFPLLALVNAPAVDISQAKSSEQIIFNVANLSPNGILIVTENQLSLGYKPGERILITLDPRGWFPVSVRIAAMICRIQDDIHPKNNNMVRSLGIKFLKVDDEHREAFLDLLRDILEKIKQKIQA